MWLFVHTVCKSKKVKSIAYSECWNTWLLAHTVCMDICRCEHDKCSNSLLFGITVCMSKKGKLLQISIVKISDYWHIQYV